MLRRVLTPWAGARGQHRLVLIVQGVLLRWVAARLQSGRAAMQFAILGPLEVRRDGRVVALGGGKPRAVLACLLLHANEPVSAERLVAALWGTRLRRPRFERFRCMCRGCARRSAITLWWRARRRATGCACRRASSTPTGSSGCSKRGQRSLAQAEAENAAAVFREALGLWRGPALADLAFEPFAQTEIARLEEQRLTALQGRIEADLALGRHGELIAELEQLVGEHPLRERLHCQLMLALYRSGRQADALAVTARAHRAGRAAGARTRDRDATTPGGDPRPRSDYCRAAAVTLRARQRCEAPIDVGAAVWRSPVAGAAESDDRSRTRGSRAARAAPDPVSSAGHAHRTRRRGQDTARARGHAEPSRATSRTERSSCR